MGIWDKLLGNGIGVAAEGVGSLALDIREAIKGKEIDPMKRLELIAKAAETQGKVNAIEAQHRTIFVSGWRPFIGWVCGFGLAYHFILRDFIIFISVVIFEVQKITLEMLPLIDISQLQIILMGMLGLGGLRTYEKIKDVSK